ncbi:MAG: PhoH family protein [Candidatus Hydrogenedentes bacterium]|nr:PhoH family protein [Candidatus Hydrogenedentota bacterium]
MSHEILLHNQEEAIKLLGKNGELRKRIQQESQVRIVDRGAKIIIVGDPKDASFVGGLLEDMLVAVRRGHTPTLAELDYALGDARAEEGGTFEEVMGHQPSIIRSDVAVHPRTHGQKHYLQAIQEFDLTLVIGPAGTGKTYLAMAAAVSALLNKRVKRLILTRPAVEAGESLGFLPGDLAEKVNPYLRPLYDALYSMVDMEQVGRFIEQERIEVAPLAFMRGRTLDSAFVILDEAQNTTADQMKMFLTRLGQGSRAVITGDVTQIDLPKGATSGLVQAAEVLRHTPGIGIVHLTKQDVVRNPLVQRIIDADEARRDVDFPGNTGDVAGQGAASA